MARILAIDWDRREVRCVLATPSGQKLKVHAAVSAPLVYAPRPGGEPRPDLAQSLRNALGGRRLGRPTTLVGVDRSAVELLRLNLPPAKDAELPELVLNQAMRQSPAAGEESALDYVVLDSDPTQPRKVLAAVLPAEQFQQIRQFCAAAGLKPRRMAVRSYASASLLARTTPTLERTCLLVNVLGDEADLTVLAEGKAALLRTVRLPGALTDDKSLGRLLAELRRTLAVGVDDQPSQPAVECVYVIGAPGEHESLLTRIGQELQLPVKPFDPLQAVGATADLVDREPGRFASLLGMILDEARGAGHMIDFLRPRRTSRPQDRRQKVVLAVGIAVMIAMGGIYYVWDALAAADRDNLALTKQLNDLKGMVKKAGEQRQVVAAVRDWQGGDVNWLDELRDLSARFPSARDMVLLRLTMTSAPRAGGGELDFQGVVRDQSIVDRMVNNIRDEYHRIFPKRVQERLPQRAYSWHFIASMTVSKRDKEQYLAQAQSPAADKKPAAEAAPEPARSPRQRSRKSGQGAE